MGDASPEKRSSGCGLLGAVFRRKNRWPRRSTSTGSVRSTNLNNLTRNPSTPSSRRKQGGFVEDVPNSPQRDNGASHKDRIIARPGQNHVRPAPAYRKPPQTAPAYNQNPQIAAQPVHVYGQGKKVPFGSTGISGELESMFEDHRSKGAGKMVRASSGNVMLQGNLGNLRQPGATTTQTNSHDYQSRNTKEGGRSTASNNGKYSTTSGVMGNVVKRQNNEPEKPPSLCRALSTRMDPEQLKILGNEDYKNGNFEEALALYDAAISIDPNKAAYRSNKSAALTALGRLLDAVLECREAIRIDPFYQRAHNRLAMLNLKLGDPEKAMYHFKHAGAESDPDVLQKAKDVKVHLNKCTEAKKKFNWNALLNECNLAISAGADSAPQIFALKAEALLRLNKHEDADVTMRHGPNFDVDDCTKYFGPFGNATLLLIRAQVNMVTGRFDDAVTAAELAAKLDSNNKEVSMVVRKAKGVAMARAKGNELFKQQRHSEACIAYGEGLNYDPQNSILLCNRAACRSKLGQYEQALNDCNAALNVRPNFIKARLRRADIYTKMQMWENCLQDCKVLIEENPNNEEVSKMLNDAQAHMKRRRESREHQDMGIMDDANSDNNDDASVVVVVSNSESFNDYTKSHEISVVLFSNKQDDKSITLFLEQLSNRYPSVKFLKVEVEDCPELEESEGVDSLPSFLLYKNGSRTKEISGNDYDLLESTIKFYMS